jgi:Asp-tRNA(Asn)/Glu-tRNA(Gln) amidotransferase A subunit family amidase
MSDPSLLSALDAVRRIREGALSAAALMEACLARVAVDEPRVRAFVHLDSDYALRQAQAADADARGGRWKALLGAPLGVKDVLDVEGLPCAYGSPIWQGYRPRADAACVALARGAGAAVMGKTVATEFATRKAGPTTNPVDPAHTPGGSSSGSAAGVRAGFFPFAFGTQTAGSIIRPAAFCGVVGYMPSHGLMHRAGMKVMSETLDVIGALARTVADCALLIGASAVADLGDAQSRPDRPPSLALCRGPAGATAEPEMLALMERAAEALSRAGASVRWLDLPPQIEAAARVHPTVMNGEYGQALAWELAHRRDQMSDLLLERIVDPALTAERMAEGRGVMTLARRVFADTMQDVDAIVTPSAPGEAPEGLDHTGDPSFNALWTALHAASVSVPVGAGPRGLPLGLQVVTPNGGDKNALAWAAWIQDALT